MEVLSVEDVIKMGIEFAGDVCFSGEYGELVCTNEIEDGGHPVNGIVFEKYQNGNLVYYCYYKDGIKNGPRVEFYESSNVKSYCIMDEGTVDGEYTEWFENGNIRLKENCKYGLVKNMIKFDIHGNVIEEKSQLTEDEKQLYEKLKDYYEKRDNPKRN